MKIQLLFNRWHNIVSCYIHYSIGLAHRYWGNTHSLHPEYEKAIDQFTLALTFKPDYAKIYLDRGILYWREIDHPRRAILDFNKALDLDPTMIEARFNRGIAHQHLREYDKAVADFQAYLREGDHPYWREYAESMVKELREWTSDTQAK